MTDPCLRCQLPDCDEDSPLCGYTTLQQRSVPRIVRSLVNSREARISQAYRAVRAAQTQSEPSCTTTP